MADDGVETPDDNGVTDETQPTPDDNTETVYSPVDPTPDWEEPPFQELI